MATTVAFSDYTENNIIRVHFRNTDFPTALATMYVALFTVMPAEDGTGGTEVTTSGTAYARQGITCGTHNTGAGSGWADTSAGNGTTSNLADINWAPATATYGTVVGVGLYDAVTSGNLIYYGVLNVNLTINTSDQFKFPAGNLTIQVQ